MEKDTKKGVEFISEDEMFSDENKPESNWFKFEKVGDRVYGKVLENPYIKEDTSGEYGDQRVFELLTKEGEEVNVGIKVSSNYLMTRTKNVRQGDFIGFEFAKEIPPKKKGYNPAKSIEVFITKTPEGDKARELEKKGEF